MSSRDPSKTQSGLFPPTWIVGQEAASLTKKDDRVLLADEFRDPMAADPDAAETSPTSDEASSAAGAAAPRLDKDGVMIADDFEDPLAQPAAPTTKQAAPWRRASPPAQTRDLRANDPALTPTAGRRSLSNDSDDRRAAETRKRLEPMSRRIDALNADLDTRANGGTETFSTPAREIAKTEPGRKRRSLRRVGLVVVATLVVAVWLVSDRLVGYEGTLPQRLDALRNDLTIGIEGFETVGWMTRLVDAKDRVVEYGAWLGERIAGGWSDSSASDGPADVPGEDRERPPARSAN